MAAKKTKPQGKEEKESKGEKDARVESSSSTAGMASTKNDRDAVQYMMILAAISLFVLAIMLFVEIGSYGS